MNYYEVYDRNSSVLLAKGNARECWKELGLSTLANFYTLVKNVLKGKNKKYIIIKKKGGDTDYPVLGKFDPLYEKYIEEQKEQEDDDADD